MKKALSVALLFCLLLTLAALPALAADQAQSQTQAGQAQPGTQVQGQDQGAQAQQSQQGPGGFLDKLSGKLADLGSSLVPVMLIVAAVVLMFSARHGKQMLVWIVAGAFLALGGWKLLVDLVRYILQ